MLPTLDVLISTCNDRNCQVPNMNLQRRAGVRFVVIGLSRSRNLALAESNADLCLPADEDTVFFDGAFENIQEAFDNQADAGVIAFKMLDADGNPTRPYPEPQSIVRMQTRRDIVQFWSSEIAFRRQAVATRNIAFNEQIGVGTGLPIGEESPFLANGQEQGLTIYYSNTPILTFPLEHSGLINTPHLWFTSGVVWLRLHGSRVVPDSVARSAIFHRSRSRGARNVLSFLAGNLYYCVRGRSRLRAK